MCVCVGCGGGGGNIDWEGGTVTLIRKRGNIDWEEG